MRKLMAGLKKVGRFVRKGINVGESIVNKADKLTGGGLRSSLGVMTGGLSEVALAGYKKSKPLQNMVLTGMESGFKNKKEIANEGKRLYRENVSDKNKLQVINKFEKALNI